MEQPMYHLAGIWKIREEWNLKCFLACRLRTSREHAEFPRAIRKTADKCSPSYSTGNSGGKLRGARGRRRPLLCMYEHTDASSVCLCSIELRKAYSTDCCKYLKYAEHSLFCLLIIMRCCISFKRIAWIGYAYSIYWYMYNYVTYIEFWFYRCIYIKYNLHWK